MVPVACVRITGIFDFSDGTYIRNRTRDNSGLAIYCPMLVQFESAHICITYARMRDAGEFDCRPCQRKC